MATKNKEITGSDITLLAPVDRAAIVLDSTKTEQDLNALVVKSKEITIVNNPAGRDEAHRAGMTLKNARISIDKTGKKVREDAQAFSVAVIAEAKRLIGVVEAEENRVFALRDNYDEKVKAEKEKADRIEKERIDRIHFLISEIAKLPEISFRDNSEDIRNALDELQDHVIDEDRYGEFVVNAMSARDLAVGQLEALLSAAMVAEEEAERVEQAAALVAEQQKELADKKAAAEAEMIAMREQFDKETALAREQIAKERAELEAARAALTPEPEEEETPDEATSLPETIVDDFEAEQPELLQESPPSRDDGKDPESATNDVPAEPIDDALIQEIAEKTGYQLLLIAEKVLAAGFHVFAEELREVGMAVGDGKYNTEIAAADFSVFLQSDLMLSRVSNESAELVETCISKYKDN